MPTPRPTATCFPQGLRRSCIVEPANYDTGAAGRGVLYL